MPIAAGTFLGRYEIISPLGTGGMGEVYLAQDKQLDRRVAIKFPSVTQDEHQAHARFLREARAASTLSHPHIATMTMAKQEKGNRSLSWNLLEETRLAS